MNTRMLYMWLTLMVAIVAMVIVGVAMVVFLVINATTMMLTFALCGIAAKYCSDDINNFLKKQNNEKKS